MFSGTDTLIIIEPIGPADLSAPQPVERVGLSSVRCADCRLAANDELYLFDALTGKLDLLERSSGRLRKLDTAPLHPVAIAALPDQGLLVLGRRGGSLCCVTLARTGAVVNERRIGTHLDDPVAIAPIGHEGFLIADRRGHRLVEVHGDAEHEWSARAGYRELLAVASRLDDAGRRELISRGLLEYPQWLAHGAAGTVLADRDKIICRAGDSLAVLKQPAPSHFGHTSLLGDAAFLLGEDSTLLRIDLRRFEAAHFRLECRPIALTAMPPNRLALATRDALLIFEPM